MRNPLCLVMDVVLRTDQSVAAGLGKKNKKGRTSPEIQSKERKHASGAPRFSSVNFSQETPVILPALTDRDFLQRASLDGYHKQPLTHTGGSEHLRCPQHQMRRLTEMKPDCPQQSSVCVETLETNPRQPDALSQTHV